MSKNSREDLRVPNVFEATRSGAASRMARLYNLHLRGVHNTMRQMQFEQTVELIRDELCDAGDASAGCDPKYQRVEDPRFLDLPCEVSDFTDAEITLNGQKKRATVRTFVLYNVPEWISTLEEQPEPIARILLIDQFRYRDDLYDVVSVNHFPETGLNVVTAALRVGLS